MLKEKDKVLNAGVFRHLLFLVLLISDGSTPSYLIVSILIEYLSSAAALFP